MDVVTLKLARRYTDQAIIGNKIYGVYWNKGSNPALTRTHDAIGLNAAVGVDGTFVQNDFDNAQIYREIGPVMDTLGNVFVRIPKFYIRKTDGVGFKTWQISKVQHPGFYLPWCFWNFTTNTELPHIDVGKHKATRDASNRLESKPNLYPLVGTNIVNMRTFAQNNNAGGLLGYQQLDIHVIDVLRTLFFIEFATLNSQAIMQGYTTGQYTAAHTATVAENNVNRIILANAHADLYRIGQTISIGTSLGGNQIFYGRTITSIGVFDASNRAINFDGAAVNIAVGNVLYNTGWRNGFSNSIAATSGSINNNVDGKYPCVYRGIESPFGDMWQFVDGVNITNHQAWICANAANYVSNVFASPYVVLGYTNASVTGWTIAMGFDANFPFAELPTTIGGTDSTFYSDHYFANVGQQVVCFGGGWIFGPQEGLSNFNMSSNSTEGSVRICGRLVKKAL